jgi:uncharacterized membrane protein YhaH (DUF805 family)
MNNYVSVLKNYVGFGGRAARPEFWWFTLVNFIIVVVLDIVDVAIKTQAIVGVYELAVLLPSLAVLARRLHDTGKTAWWILIGLIPLIGAIVLIVFTCQPGTPGPNQHGENPTAGAVGAGPYVA